MHNEKSDPYIAPIFFNRKIRRNARLLLRLTALFFVTSTVTAVPLNYCENLSTHMRSIVCDISAHDNGDLITLDYQVSLIYEFAYFSSKNSAKLKKNQRLWLNKKELCKTRDCVFEINRNRVRELVAIIDGHPNKPGNPENTDLKGLWRGGDRAARATYGTILITDHVIIWGGEKRVQNHYCKTTYSIEKEPFGISFQDQIGGTYVFNEKSQFKTYKLKLKPSKSVSSPAYLRFTLPYANQNYSDVIEYDQNDDISGYLGFHKYKN
jgi:uncharacterized protein